VEQQIALAEGCFANCYNQASFKIGGRDISSIDSFFAQASALEARVNNSGAWMDKLGSYAMGYNGDRSSRVAAISRTAGVGNLAPVGLNLNEGKEEISRPTDGKTPDTATLEGIVNTRDSRGQVVLLSPPLMSARLSWLAARNSQSWGSSGG
jgi:hypothetical protein